MTVDLTDATLGQDGQIIITGEDGHSTRIKFFFVLLILLTRTFNFVGYPITVNGMITVPVSASMYQTMIANIQQLHPNGDGTVCITPMQVNNNSSNSMSNSTTTNTTTSTTSSHDGKLIQAIISGARGHTNINNNNNMNFDNRNHKKPLITGKLVENGGDTHAIIDSGGNVVLHLSAATTTTTTKASSSTSLSPLKKEIKKEFKIEPIVI